jgi:nitroimidazol reductase NimA-like FMN-containing flavoprotein (pyridoxamine 5'-phosphate oxidase superfamily)
MRRNEKAVTDPVAIEAIIAAARVCRLAMCDRGRPYVVPLCFGYQDRVFYFHSAAQGRKLDVLNANPRVCVELESDVTLQPADKPCEWGMGFNSVIAFGTARRVSDPDEKRRALDAIMNHYGDGPWTYSEKVSAATVVIRVDVDEITAKHS